jgi:hypothetical protein
VIIKCADRDIGDINGEAETRQSQKNQFSSIN